MENLTTRVKPPEAISRREQESQAPDPSATWWVAWGLCRDHAHTWTREQVREITGLLENELERRRRNRKWLLARIRRMAADSRPRLRLDRWTP